VRKRYEDENKFRRSLVETLTKELGAKLEDIIDEMQGTSMVMMMSTSEATTDSKHDKRGSASSSSEKGSKVSKSTDEGGDISYFDMFFNSVSGASKTIKGNEEEEEDQDEDRVPVVTSVVAPSWEEMEFHQADCERKDDAMLVERLISYGAKITQCVAGAKQEVI
jgi:hypothetical protein